MSDPRQQQDQNEEGKKWLRWAFFCVSCITFSAIAYSIIYAVVGTEYHAQKGASGSNGGVDSECMENCLEQFGITSSITGPCKYNGKGYGGIPKGKIDPIVKYLASKGYTKIAIAGIIGNWVQESGLEPNNCQNGPCESQYGDTEACAYKDPNYNDDNQCGYGLAQWTYGSRKDRMVSYHEKTGLALSNLNFQLDFFNYEADTFYTNLKSEINKASTPEQAVYTFERIYEGAGEPAYSNRVDAANAIYQDISCDSTGTTQPIQEGEQPATEETESSTSSFSGRRIIAGIPYMNQNDYKPDLPSFGCGITSSSMLSEWIAKQKDKDAKVSPNDFLDEYGYGLIVGITEYTGYEVQDVKYSGTNIDQYISGITKLIDQQIPSVIFTGYNKGPNNIYGHVMLITGYITDNKGKITHIVVNDPGFNYVTKDKNGQNAEYPIAEFKKYLTDVQHYEGTHYYYINKPGNVGFLPSDLPGDYDPSMTPEEYCKKKCATSAGGVYDSECGKIITDIAAKPNDYQLNDGSNNYFSVNSCCAYFASKVLNKAIEKGAKIHPSYENTLKENNITYITRTTWWADLGDEETEEFSKEGKNIGIKIDNINDLKPGDIITFHRTFTENGYSNYTHTGVVSEEPGYMYDCSGTNYKGKGSYLSDYYTSRFAEGRRVCLSGGGGGPTGELKDECKIDNPCIEQNLSDGNFDHIYLHWTGAADSVTFPQNGTADEAKDFNSDSWDDNNVNTLTIGYHFVITDNGQIYCNYPTNTLLAHTAYRNNNSIAISVTYDDNYAQEPLTNAEVESMGKLVAIIAKKYGINIDIQHVLSHIEAGSSKDANKDSVLKISTSDQILDCKTNDNNVAYKADKYARENGLLHCNYGAESWSDGWPGGAGVKPDITAGGHNYADDVRAKALQCFTAPTTETPTAETPTAEGTTPGATAPGTTTGQ